MKVHLMFCDRPFDREAPLPDDADALSADLGLEALLEAMSGGDKELLASARGALFHPLTDPAEIRYRQAVLADCLAVPDAARKLYDAALSGIEADRHIHIGFAYARPSSRRYRSQQCLTAFLQVLHTLRDLADEYADTVESQGLRNLCRRLQRELDDAYLDQLDLYLRILAFPRGTLESVRLGRANRGIGHVLRTLRPPRGPWARVVDGVTRHRHTVVVNPRDLAGMDSLGELADLGVQRVAEVLVESSDHVLAFFTALRDELAFYLACANLHRTLTQTDQPLCVPTPLAGGEPHLDARGLYSPLLALQRVTPIGNDVHSVDQSGLLVLTGTNQGGKSTLLRALGIAHLLMQSGMSVPATDFEATVIPAVHTHFKRPEDAGMEHGKFDEELGRLSHIVSQVVPGDLVLCNESFSSTNEREAAVVGGDVIEALLAHEVRVHLVTHQFALADRLHRDLPTATFLRAVREEDGSRPFRLVPGEPLRTSYARDLYREVFSTDAQRAATPPIHP